LQAEDFIITDDGVEQWVHLDEVFDSSPVSLVIAVQRGGSAGREFARMRGLGEMLDPVIDQGKTEIAIVEFDSHVRLTRDFTKDGSAIRRQLANPKPADGGAAILDAVNYAVKLLDKKPNDRQRVLLLISETRDHGSSLTITDVATTLANSNTVTYTLVFSPAISALLDPFRGPARNNDAPMDLLASIFMSLQAMRRNVPKAIASLTGGEYQVFKSDKGFDLRMTEFDNHLFSRYLLSFEPKDPHPGFHGIQVRLRRPAGVEVLARTSYWIEPVLEHTTKIRP
jgi:VWFA-related protein